MNQPDYFDTPQNFPPSWASAYGQDIHGYWLDMTIYQQTLRFRWIPKGKFTMGSVENELDRDNYEDQHEVHLTQGFWLADSTVTQVLYQAVLGENPSHFKDNLYCPVETVNWDDAHCFMAKIIQDYPEIHLRLPWEAEWEYACRAGTDTPFYFGENITPEQVNYDGNEPYLNAKKGLYRETTVPVKSLPSNPWGLYEMHGNVWEWCEDVWQDSLGGEAVSDPWLIGGKEGEKERSVVRVVRGGSWYGYGRLVRSAFRSSHRPDDRIHGMGFRLSLGL